MIEICPYCDGELHLDIDLQISKCYTCDVSFHGNNHQYFHYTCHGLEHELVIYKNNILTYNCFNKNGLGLYSHIFSFHEYITIINKIALFMKKNGYIPNMFRQFIDKKLPLILTFY